MGDSVSATMPEMSTAIASENANSLNSTPVRPERKPIGAYTVASVIVIAMIGFTSWRELASAAWVRVIPWRMYRATFSTTTIASSTTNPTDNTIASTVSRLSEKPISDIAATAPSNEIGIVTSGTSAARNEPMKTTITRPTSITVSARVMKISRRALRMYLVTSKASRTARPSGIVTLISSSITYMAFAMSISLAPGSGQMATKTESTWFTRDS